MAIESIRHKNENRPHIPSQEEAGMEAASPKVKKDASLQARAESCCDSWTRP